MRELMDLYKLINLVKITTCFKGRRSCIDLLLTNQIYSFKKQKHLRLALMIIRKTSQREWFMETIFLFQRTHFKHICQIHLKLDKTVKVLDNILHEKQNC